MDITYCSSSRGGTLHLSPTHHHTVDALATLRELRRSMSRSPSKRHCQSRSMASSPRSPLSPSQQRSPLHHLMNASECSDENVLASPRKARPLLRRAANPLRFSAAAAAAASSTPSRGPIRRALSDSSDNGNGNASKTDASPTSYTPKTSPHVAAANRGAPAMGFFPATEPPRESTKPVEFSLAKSSPLKRSDGVMNLEHAALGSPSNKRRSLHAGFFGSNFRASLLDTDDDMEEDDDDDDDDDEEYGDDQDDVDWSAHLPAHEQTLRSLTSGFSPARKPSSPNRPVLRSHGARNRRSLESGIDSPVATRVSTRSRPRNSLDSNVPARLFEPSRSLSQRQHAPPNLTVRTQLARGARHQPHPLSQAISPSSPTPTRSEHGDRHIQVFESPESATKVNFAKSLPIGALRPGARDTKVALNDVSSSSTATFDTPEAYKLARPDPAGFRSTGLISKRHRDPEDLPPPPDKTMPDTPCKKVPAGFGFSPSPNESRTIAQPRFLQPDFDTPSRPPHAQPSHTPAPSSSQPTSFAHSLLQSRSGRRASVVSNDGDDTALRPVLERGESQSSADELPPTPTKQAGSHSKNNSLRSSLLGRRPSLGPGTFVKPEIPNTPANEPVAVFQRPVATTYLSPHTPFEPVAQVPDPSGLSISPYARHSRTPSFSSAFGGAALPPPETPTSHRALGETTTFLGTHHLMMTPSNTAPQHDVDPALYARFKKVEWYGRGEFSEVYKVYRATEPTSYFSPAVSFGSSAASQTPMPDKIFVVKKAKAPLGSAKIRQRKLREVSVMSALGKNDHVVSLIDSWEANNHLYIQTEFCEEGSLAVFLEKQGRRGRLDDFRIWKILLELSQGVKHIHDSGFIHLDLKPANVFIDFEGTLKIGDFGLACEWPAPNNIEGEGDRRYIGPDLLQGLFDKPADIFALGMIIFEVASNVDLPDNGESWQQLRSGNWSGLPSLTSGSTNSLFPQSQDRFITSGSFDSNNLGAGAFGSGEMEGMEQSWRDVASYRKTPSLDEQPQNAPQPPDFMVDPENRGSLDRLVQWMMSPDPQARPVIDQVLDVDGCLWVRERRRFGATVFEGQWGPAPHLLRDHEDTVMMDIS